MVVGDRGCAGGGVNRIGAFDRTLRIKGFDMGFIERFEPTGPDGDQQYSFHELSAIVFLIANGDFTKAQLKTAYGLDATDDQNLDELTAYYQGLTADKKREFHNEVESWGMMVESGKLTMTQLKTHFGLT